MPLTPGQNLGPYEILALLGAGGMGEVYKARDTRLDRQVAIKVLPAALTESEKVRARFEREARTISQLNHSAICTLHDVGNEDGVEYLVMEHIEGDSLESLLESGPLPLDQALRYSIQIMNALDAAHRQRVVHRDLKPANVMITATGAKLLDFGLAKIAAEAVEPSGGSQSEIATQMKNLTEEGTILGTVQYMAPEQLEGGEADPRTDIFAFGMLLFEMITGRKAFDGKSRVSLMAAILEHPPQSVSEIQPLTPPALDRLIRTCLEKSPDDRWQTAHDVELQLRWIEEGGSEVGLPAPVTRKRKGRERLAWLVAAVAVTAAVVLAFVGPLVGRAPAERRVVRTSIVPPAEARFNTGRGLALSPDGTKLVFAVDDEQGRRLYVRNLDDLESRRIEGSDRGANPFWSPDSAHIAFFVEDKLKRVTADGETPQTICDAPGGRGGAWNDDGVIVFSRGSGSGRGALYRVAAGGGEAVALTELAEGEFSHRWPHFLPDGERLLFSRQTGEGAVEDDLSTIDVLSLSTGEATALIRANSSVQYVRTGHLLYWREGAVLAHPFDVDRLEPTGDPIPLLGSVAYSNAEFASVSVSREGTLAYHSGAGIFTQFSVYDRSGVPLERIGPEAGGLSSPTLSPDGTRLAYVRDRDIWVLDLERGAETPLTFGEVNVSPVWSPDGEWVAFGSTLKPWGVYRKRASGAGQIEPLFTVDDEFDIPRPGSWADDGTLVASAESAGTGVDIYLINPDAQSREALVATPFNDGFPVLSPNGQWLAYNSNESDLPEVFVQRRSGEGRRWQISAGGGWQPSWSADGRTLYYLARQSRLMAVPVETGATFSSGVPEALMQVETSGIFRRYTVSADGSRVVWAEVGDGSAVADPVTLVQGWESLLTGER